MNTHTIDLIHENAPNLGFIQASSYIVTENSARFAECKTNEDCQDLLLRLWEEHYKSKLVQSHIVFNNSNDMMVFCLRWGS